MRPIYYREKKAQLYTANAYFLATFLAGSLTLLFYPLVVGTITFYFFENTRSSFVDMLRWDMVLFL